MVEVHQEIGLGLRMIQEHEKGQLGKLQVVRGYGGRGLEDRHSGCRLRNRSFFLRCAERAKQVCSGGNHPLVGCTGQCGLAGLLAEGR